MRPKIVLLHDAQAEAGRPDSADTLVEAQAITAALATLGYDAATAPVGLDLGALERGLRARRRMPSSISSSRSRAAASWCTSSPRCSSRWGYRSRVAPPSRWRRRRTRSRRRSASPPRISRRRRCSAARPSDGLWIVKSICEHASLGIDDSSVVAAPPCRACSRRAGRSSAAAGSPSASSRVASSTWPSSPARTARGRCRWRRFGSRASRRQARDRRLCREVARRQLRVPEHRSLVRHRARARGASGAAGARLLGAVRARRLRARRLSGRRQRPLSVLEINANPCLSPDAGFAAALDQAGIGYADAIGWLIAAARRRADPHRMKQAARYPLSQPAVGRRRRAVAPARRRDAGLLRRRTRDRARAARRAAAAWPQVQLRVLLCRAARGARRLLRLGRGAADARSYDLYWIAVAAAAQGQGVGQALLRSPSAPWLERRRQPLHRNLVAPRLCPHPAVLSRRRLPPGGVAARLLRARRP